MRATSAIDMWAFGLIIFELFARQPFFSDKPDTMQQLASYAELEVPKDVVDDIQVRVPVPAPSFWLRLFRPSLCPSLRPSLRPPFRPSLCPARHADSP